MIDWTNFEVIFRSQPDYSLDPKQVETIQRHRKEFGGTLFLDRIWNSIGLKQPQKAYPPKSNAELRNLWQKVAKADVADEKKQAILFYVLKDCKQTGNLDTTFTQSVYLPWKYQVLVSGLWELDHGQFSRALEHLTDPSLTAEFADDILLTLLRSPKCDKTLAMGYYVAIGPPLVKTEALEAYFDALLQSNVVEAYRFSRKKTNTTHKHLFEEMIRGIHEEEESGSKAARSTTLLSLPLTTEEDCWFEDYLLRGSGSRLPGAKDSVIARRMAVGKSIEGIGSLDRHRGQKVNGVNWDDVRVAQRTITTTTT